jgi:hypothetical protein
MGSLVHTGLGSSSLVTHVLPYPPPPHANSFVLGPAVINTHTHIQPVKKETMQRERPPQRSARGEAIEVPSRHNPQRVSMMRHADGLVAVPFLIHNHSSA